MTVEWFEANEEVLEIAEDIIDKYHPELKWINIGFVFRSEAPNSNGKRTLGKAKKVTDKDRVFTKTPNEVGALEPLHFIIWVAHDWWAYADTMQRRALIDHELCHCKYDIDEGKASIRPHDIEESNCIIERYGFWRADLEATKEAVEKTLQLTLPGADYFAGRVVAVDPERAVIEVEA